MALTKMIKYQLCTQLNQMGESGDKLNIRIIIADKIHKKRLILIRIYKHSSTIYICTVYMLPPRCPTEIFDQQQHTIQRKVFSSLLNMNEILKDFKYKTCYITYKQLQFSIKDKKNKNALNNLHQQLIFQFCNMSSRR